MIPQILKTVLAGVLAGVAIFMMPFIIIKVLIFFLLIKAIFRLMGGGRRHHWRYAYAHKYKNMSEEERAAFKEDNAKRWAGSRWGGNGCGWNYHCGTEDCEPADNKDKTTGV